MRDRQCWRGSGRVARSLHSESKVVLRPLAASPTLLRALIVASIFLVNAACVAADPKKPTLISPFGEAPVIDGHLAKGEWADATEFSGVRDWVPEFTAVTNDADLALRGWVKHDRQWLYFAFDITDDVLYGIDTERWL